MIRYEEKKSMKDVTPAELSKAEAKKLTQKIKTAVDDLWTLLVKAREGKAWKALGYKTWEAYVTAEFGMTRQRSYQLLDQGKIVEAIRDASGDLSTTVDISERDARDLKHDLPAVTEEIRARVESGDDPEKAVTETVAAKRSEKEKARAAKKADPHPHQDTADDFVDSLPPDPPSNSEDGKPPSPSAPTTQDTPASEAPTDDQISFEELRAALETLLRLKPDDYLRICPRNKRAAMCQRLSALTTVFEQVKEGVSG